MMISHSVILIWLQYKRNYNETQLNLFSEMIFLKKEEECEKEKIMFLSAHFVCTYPFDLLMYFNKYLNFSIPFNISSPSPEWNVNRQFDTTGMHEKDMYVVKYMPLEMNINDALSFYCRCHFLTILMECLYGCHLTISTVTWKLVRNFISHIDIYIYHMFVKFITVHKFYYFPVETHLSIQRKCRKWIQINNNPKKSNHMRMESSIIPGKTLKLNENERVGIKADVHALSNSIKSSRRMNKIHLTNLLHLIVTVKPILPTKLAFNFHLHRMIIMQLSGF